MRIFEIRNYKPSLFTSVKLSTKGYIKILQVEGFLFYQDTFLGITKEIKNSHDSQVAMKLDDSITMMFMVPNKLKRNAA